MKCCTYQKSIDNSLTDEYLKAGFCSMQCKPTLLQERLELLIISLYGVNKSIF